MGSGFQVLITLILNRCRPARPLSHPACGSLFENNMEVETAMEMQRHLDETGVHRVCIIYV
jgi:hypothetical protein